MGQEKKRGNHKCVPLTIARVGGHKLTKATAVNLKHNPYDVLVARPSAFGNPYKYPQDGTRKMVVRLFCKWLEATPQLVERAKVELRGKRLGCHCAPDLCHAEVLAWVANGGSVQEWIKEVLEEL